MPLLATSIQPEPKAPPLRDRLVAMRADLILQLDERIDGGTLALLVHVATCIAVIDAAAEEQTGCRPAARVGFSERTGRSAIAAAREPPRAACRLQRIC